MGAGDIEGGARLGGGVLAAEGAQVGVLQRLDAQRDAVDAGRGIAPEPGGLDAGGVGFERDFGAGGEAKPRRR